jgi:hypothetical protein
MRRDRLQVVVQVRQLLERRRLAERADAERALRTALVRRAEAEDTRQGAVPAAGETGVEALLQHRATGMALNEAVDRAVDGERLARHDLAQAEDRRTRAAIARRSAERLDERRADEAAVRAARLADKQLDAVALESWRRRR